jgi:teichoic acid transport system permease protein
MLKTIVSLPINVYENRRLVWKLAKNDFKTRYAGSYLGAIWAFIQPIVTILVYWFVFSLGMKASTGPEAMPFVLFLLAGIVPWFYFQDSLNGGTTSLLEYNYLVKKVVFNISVLPVVKILSALFCALLFYFDYDSDVLGIWVYPGYLLSADYLLFLLRDSSCPGAYVCDKRNCCLFP